MSIYKEENAKLREELEELRSGGGGVADRQREVDSSESAEAAEGALESASSGPSIETREETREETTSEDDTKLAAKEEAQSPTEDEEGPDVGGEASGAPKVNAEQLMSEVDELLNMGAELSEDSSGLDDDLDTDQLLREAANMPEEKSNG